MWLQLICRSDDKGLKAHVNSGAVQQTRQEVNQNETSHLCMNRCVQAPTSQMVHGLTAVRRVEEHKDGSEADLWIGVFWIEAPLDLALLRDLVLLLLSSSSNWSDGKSLFFWERFFLPLFCFPLFKTQFRKKALIIAIDLVHHAVSGYEDRYFLWTDVQLL